MELRRRGFLGFLGLAPLAGPAAAQQLGTQTGLNALRSMAYMHGGQTLPSPAVYDESPPWSRAGLGKMFWKALDRERDERAGAFERNMAYRFGALEHDIAVMKSWSPSFAVHQQRQRDMAHHAYMRDTANKLWPRPED